MFAQRKALYTQLEKMRGSKVITYVTGDRQPWATQIGSDVFDFFANHLDEIGDTQKISLFLYTNGGDTLAARSIINLLRQFCKELEVIVPAKCHSAGTLMSLGANKIVMTKQATLGPIDPSVNGPLNPQVQINGQVPQPWAVSVEEIKGYIAVARQEFGIDDGAGLSQILHSLSEKVHPLVLGRVYRAKSQIQMLARKLLVNQVTDEATAESIISFLCSESGSHDYTINRVEALGLGLKVEKPNEELYQLIKQIYDDIKEELQLGQPFDAEAILGARQDLDYVAVRCLIEAPDTCSYQLRTEMRLSRIVQNQGGQQNFINNAILNEGWKAYDQ
ncbi:SDH family Clp fold serine proteinase [Klebsiella michiganensis]|uniref:SDH family Clp fold serine proteinase n=1 Tax=Klebsiella TaxID=570 RepID=UPI0012B71733|nr:MULTISPECIES: serine protease [Klebsiella]HDG9794472.1 serine protease [Raoultella planticola]MBE8895739.1 serine protease [Klebsiella grimontii]MDH1344507.1 serine protease [Klebsiella michiganensis]MDS7862028.1 serine protease [Klebsiella michiganensis]HDH7776612.1 serine protease [Raoultella planticola]